MRDTPEPSVNAHGRHYTLKSTSRTSQPLDPARATLHKIAETTPKLRKLG